jgi:penicillin-binding protein 1C
MITKLSHKRNWFLIILLAFSTLLFAAAGGFWWLVHDLPSIDSIPEHLILPSLRITDRSGRLLYEALPEQGGRQTFVPLKEIPLILQQATIAVEDGNFYQHPGVDVLGILRAFWINLHGGETLAGGSTITQQVARNLLLEDQERYQQTLHRKLREAYLAWQLTRQLSKERVLELYLNYTYYGGMAYGVEAAAQTFFGKPVTELDLAECAIIAGLPQAPAVYNPYSDEEAAHGRQEVVLESMVREGYINSEQAVLSTREPLVLTENPYPMEAPHFVLQVLNQLDHLVSPADHRIPEGLVVRTTLNLDWQHLAEVAIRSQIVSLQNTPDGLGHNLNSAALVALDPHNGEILTMVGSPDYYDERNAGAINMTLSPRQPGSALKPIIYSLALSPDQPQSWTAATSLLDVHTTFVTRDGKAYVPENYDQQEHGPVLLREALGSSLNIPAVITLDHVGLPAFFKYAASLGIDTFSNPEDYDLSLALGGGEVRLLDLTAAYGSFANGGIKVLPNYILDIHDGAGNIIYTATAMPGERVVDEHIAWLISDILSDDNARLMGFGRNSVLQIDRPAAVKTGTTSNFHDNWTVGYTPDLVVGVWAGNTTYEPMHNVSGVSGAAPIWHDFIRSALRNQPVVEFTRPGGLVQVEVCALSGALPTEDCPYHKLEWFIEGTQPTAQDTFYQRVRLDQTTGNLAEPGTPPDKVIERLALDLPPQAQSWARSQGLLLLSDLLSTQVGIPGSSTLTESQPLRLVSPAQLSIYRQDPDFPRDAQRIQVAAAAEAGFGSIRFYIDGFLLAEFDTPPYQTWWMLSVGQHEAWAEGSYTNGETLRSPIVQFTVVEK